MDSFSQPVPTSTVKYAGFWRRFLAYHVDFLIIFTVGYILLTTFGENPILKLASAKSTADIQNFQTSPLVSLVYLAAVVAYYLIFYVNYDGATPGKRLLAIKVTRDDGTAVSYPIVFIRYLASYLSAFALGLGYFWVAFDGKKQSWHDKIAKTVVVETSEKPRTILAIFLTLLIIVSFNAYIGFAFYTGIKLGIQSAKNTGQLDNLRNREGGALPALLNDGQLPTQLQADELATSVFNKLNEKRVSNGLTAFTTDPQLCAYTQRRLDQLITLGKGDDGRGFYEDVANPQINAAYFTYYLKMGTIMFTLSPTVTTPADDVVTSWTNDPAKTGIVPTYTYGCVKANPQFLVLVAGEHK